MNNLITLIIAPIAVGITTGIANKLFSYWLDKKSNNRK